MRKLLVGFSMLSLAILTASSQLHAVEKQPSTGVFESAHAIARDAMKELEKGQIDAMFAVFKTHCPIDHADLDRLQAMLKQQRQFVGPTLGEPMGEIDFVSQDCLGSSFVRFIYLEKWDNSALVWKLTFYRGRDGWKVNQITWTDKPLDLFQ